MKLSVESWEILRSLKGVVSCLDWTSRDPDSNQSSSIYLPYCVCTQQLPRATWRDRLLLQIHLPICLSATLRARLLRFRRFSAVLCRFSHRFSGKFPYSISIMTLQSVHWQLQTDFTCFSRFSSTCVKLRATCSYGEPHHQSRLSPGHWVKVSPPWKCPCFFITHTQQPCTNYSTEVM